MSETRKPQRASRYLRGAMVAAALALPTLSLAVLGSVWLWQHGAFLIWSAAAASIAVLIYAVAYVLVERGEKQALETVSHSDAGAGETEALTPRERRARQAIARIAAAANPEKLTSRDAILQLGIETVEAVAHEMHPGEKDPLWRFTVPEALTVVARASNEINRFVVDNIPLGDRLTVGQMMTLYKWRGVIDIAEKAHDLWRILRLANPASAIAGELRERLSGKLVEDMRSEVAERLARAYVDEVGRAAVDLYSGRLRLEPPAADAAIDALAAPAPVRVLLLGQHAVGRTAVSLALSATASAAVALAGDGGPDITLAHDGKPFARLIDAPALRDDEAAMAAAVEQALTVDAIVWVVSATRPDRHLDARVIQRIREAYASRSERRTPPIVAALTHVDRLRPFAEWSPPYDLTSEAQPKAASIRDAVAAVADDLDMATQDLVPVMTARDRPAYNVDVLWARLVEIVPQARQSMLARNLAEARSTRLDWARLWSQAVSGGRVIGKVLTRSGKPPSTGAAG